MNKLLSTVAVAFALTGGSATAQGVPTIDVSSIAQLQQMLAEARLQLNEAVSQNLKLDDQTLKLIEQIRLMEDQYKALTDSFEDAKLLLTTDWWKDLLPEIEDIPGALKDATEGNWGAIGTGGKIGSRTTREIVDGIFASAGTSTEDMTDLANSEDPGAARIGVQGNTGALMGVAAEASQEAAGKSLERIEELTGNIPDTQGMKAAIDLNTRMTAEMGMALANIWQLEAAQTIGLGQAGVMTAATLADEQKYLDLTPSDTSD